MKHARPEYDRIQDPENKIPEDEPVFLIRAQDMTAPDTVEYWAYLNEGMDDNLVRLAREQVRKMREWQDKHGRKIADG